MTLENKRIILTGATSGIGKSLAIRLAKHGAKLAVCGRSSEKMEVLTAELQSAGQAHYSKTFSITDENEIVQFVKESAEQLGGVDVLINCAGANTARGQIGEIKTADLDEMYAVNFRAPFIFMREAYNLMKPHQNGTVVNVLSTVCLFSNENIAAYTATKAGIEAMTKVFRKEARREGIKVCSVYPGGVDTPFRAADRPDYMSADSVADAIIAMLNMPEDVAVHDLILRPMVEDNF
ncbi:SDR family oxidoreductase [Limibacter armeniacum]|uniref:SDR family oxidoreductase n=1 Tax=Limibacter armeniacum TaxID=466084 RepID=UPI002FE61674